jgi:hypothetical protein
VYEGFWIKAFLDSLHARYPEADKTVGCDTLGERVINSGWTSKLAQELGTKKNFMNTMTAFTSIENGLKHRFFHPTTPIDTQHANEQNRKVKLCIIGRIVNTCQYMMHPKTQVKLKNTLNGLQTVL